MKIKQMKHWVICVPAATLLSNTGKYPSRH